ncbi:DUF4180 domain-containing protein [Paenibacillus filicis]|uniref:DUF4180 domain-containing protein n=1 Tax=Paenibacillus filicis TaxID=669464 RepID=A0ABU9DEB5_9BACL
MSIKLAILGMLSWIPATGYDLKKMIEESSAMYWSGNNNQIYKSLVQLLDEGLVTNEVQHQESSPSKKIYTITGKGQEELKRWVLSAPELPELKKGFLTQLAWADSLSSVELDDLLSRYEQEVSLQLALEEEKKRRALFSPSRSSREAYLWEMIDENIVASYRHELSWVRQLREGLLVHHNQDVNGMDYQVVRKQNRLYIEYISAEPPVCTDQDILALIAVCMEQNAELLMLHSEVLSKDFFELRTGVAGHIIQKLTNYRIRTALIAGEESQEGRFKELAAEMNRGHQFRVFSSATDAEQWLLNGK